MTTLLVPPRFHIRLCTMLAALMVIGTCSWALGLFKTVQVLTIPLPPGERSITRLQLQPDGNVYGFVPGPDKKFRFLRIVNAETGGVSNVATVPDIVLPPAEILANPALPWQWDGTRKQGYALDSKGHFMTYQADGTTKDLGMVAGERPYEEKEAGLQISRALVATPGGEVYTAGDKGTIFKYVPGATELVKLTASLPAVVGREAWASLDAAVVGPDGLIYGGTFDGYLFTFNPQTNAVINLGKPFRAQRMQALTFRKGILYGIGGDVADIPRVFSFDPATRGFTIGGLITAGPDPALANIIYEPIGALAADAAGNVYFSSMGRMGNLYTWKME